MGSIGKYERKGALLIGILQISLAVLLVGTQLPWYMGEYGLLPALGGIGFWTGLFFGACGGLSMGSSKSSSQCLIIAVMVMDILASLVSLVGIGFISLFGIIAAGPGSQRSGPHSQEYKVVIGLSVTQGILCFIEIILSIVGSALCCAALCGTSDEVQVVYVTSGEGGQQQVVIVGQQEAGPNPQGDQRSGPNLKGDQYSGPNPKGDQCSGPNPKGDQRSVPNPKGDQCSGPNLKGDQRSGPNLKGDQRSGPNPKGDQRYGAEP